MEDDNGSEMYVVQCDSNSLDIKGFTISDFKDSIKSDDTVSNVNLDGNVLTFTISDDTAVKVVESANEDGVTTFK